MSKSSVKWRRGWRVYTFLMQIEQLWKPSKKQLWLHDNRVGGKSAVSKMDGNIPRRGKIGRIQTGSSSIQIKVILWKFQIKLKKNKKF